MKSSDANGNVAASSNKYAKTVHYKHIAFSHLDVGAI